MTFKIPKIYKKILLINSAAFDTRLPWAYWHQPVGLLKIGGYLKASGFDVRIIDSLQMSNSSRLPKEKQRSILIENTKIDFWRIGLSPKKIISEIANLEKTGWSPDLILVSVGMSFWWEAARELIQELKTITQVPVWLGGAYPTYYYDHAVEHSGADVVKKGPIAEVLHFRTDFSVYSSTNRPTFAGIHLLENEPDVLVDEIKEKIRLGVKTFVIFDNIIGPENKESFLENLDAISACGLVGLKFVAPGNISPRAVDDKIAKLLKKLNFTHVFLHDDVEHSPTAIKQSSSWNDYQKCVTSLHKAGFVPRTDEIGAAVLIGLPKENLPTIIQKIVKLSSIAGSVHLVPYQYTPNSIEGKKYDKWVSQMNGHVDITSFNGRLFPLARIAGKSFDDYLELTRMIALLNSKFRSCTFDFLGNSITGQMVRRSLAEDLWTPSLPLERDERIQLVVAEK